MTWATRRRLRFLLDVTDVRAGEEGGELLSVSIHHGVVPRSTMTDDEPRADRLDKYKRVLPGDIVINRMRAFQGAFHNNPDYTLWYGWSEMVRDLSEIKGMAKELRAAANQ